METQGGTSVMEPASQMGITQGSRRRGGKLDPRLRGKKRALQCEIDERAWEILAFHAIKRGRQKGDVVTELILDGLPSWVLQERGGTGVGTPVASSGGSGESAVEAEPIPETLTPGEDPAGGKTPGQGRGKRGSK